MDPRFELDPLSLGVTDAPADKQPKKVRRSGRSRAKKSFTTGTAGTSTYTVKPGDNLFKILMQDYGLNYDEADALIEDVCRENNITDIRQLKVGQNIVIPLLQRSSGGAGQAVPQQHRHSATTGIGGKSFRLGVPGCGIVRA